MTRFFSWLDRLGSIAAVALALAAPCCLPLFATVSAAIGATAFGLDESLVWYALEACALLSVIGLAFGALRHRQFGSLILGGIATLALFFSFHARFSAPVVYLGLAGLCVASVWNYFTSRKLQNDGTGVTLKSVITCPRCGHRTEETCRRMPACFFTIVPLVRRNLSRNPAIAACSAATDQCRARQFKAGRRVARKKKSCAGRELFSAIHFFILLRPQGAASRKA